MYKSQDSKTVRSEGFDTLAEKPEAALGRKRNHALDALILNAAIDVLAESGFDGMTMDMVAARAKTGKTTVYRRWASKSELVLEAMSWLRRKEPTVADLPDTGTLRGDLLAAYKPTSLEVEERKLRAMAGFGSLFLQYPEFAEAGNAAIFGPWVAVFRSFMQRAIDRGEIPAHADIEMASQLITSMACFRRLIQRQPFDKAFYIQLIDGILLPALKQP